MMRIFSPQAIDLFNLVSTFFVVLSILQVRTIIKRHLECSKLHIAVQFAVISVVIKDHGHGGSDDGDEKVDQVEVHCND